MSVQAVKCCVSFGFAVGNLLNAAGSAVLFEEEDLFVTSHVQQKCRVWSADELRSFANHCIEAKSLGWFRFIFVSDVPFVDPRFDGDPIKSADGLIKCDMCFAGSDPMGNMVLNWWNRRSQSEPVVVEMLGKQLVSEGSGEINGCGGTAVWSAKQHLLAIEIPRINEQLQPSARNPAIAVGGKAEPLDLRSAENVILRDGAKDLDVTVGYHFAPLETKSAGAP